MEKLESINNYYLKFTELVSLHKILNFGNNPPIPSVFSETLVKILLDYENWTNRDFDAKSNGLGIEIKSTGTNKGITSINVDKLKSKDFSHWKGGRVT